MAIDTGTGAVSRGALARQIVRVTDVARIGTAMIGKTGELENQGAFAGAGGMSEGRCFANMIDMALDATPGVGAVIVAMLLAGAGECRVAAISRRCAVTDVAAARSGQSGCRPLRSSAFKMTVDFVAAAQLGGMGLRPGGSAVIVGGFDRRTVDF